MLSGTNVRIVLKSIIFSYVLTGIMLLLTAFLLYQLEPERSLVSIGILAIYVLGSFFAGLFAGKGIGSKKFLWGLLAGALYFLLLLAASWMFAGGVSSAAVQLLTTALLCLGGGMLGGMLA